LLFANREIGNRGPQGAWNGAGHSSGGNGMYYLNWGLGTKKENLGHQGAGWGQKKNWGGPPPRCLPPRPLGSGGPAAVIHLGLYGPSIWGKGGRAGPRGRGFRGEARDHRPANGKGRKNRVQLVWNGGRAGILFLCFPPTVLDRMGGMDGGKAGPQSRPWGSDPEKTGAGINGKGGWVLSGQRLKSDWPLGRQGPRWGLGGVSIPRTRGLGPQGCFLLVTVHAAAFQGTKWGILIISLETPFWKKKNNGPLGSLKGGPRVPWFVAGGKPKAAIQGPTGGAGPILNYPNPVRFFTGNPG